jgi:hypothetical protein
MNRREFLLNSLGLAGIAYAGSVFTSCSSPTQITGILSGPNKELGHRLRNEIVNSKIEKTLQHDVVIIGGGVSGLAAARYLKKNDVDFTIIELEKRTGGNAQYGSNSVSSFPLGAHYLPVPGLHDSELIRFLEECHVITSYEKGLPVYNEYYICFDPKERLYINGHWQEGLVPRSGLPAADAGEMERFHQLMQTYKQAKGADGKEAFCIPLAFCSTDSKFTGLDAISFETFLKQQHFTSPYLFWYVNYCCADDYGALAGSVSAWAGIHYFASRKGIAANAESDAVLTWPEGNGWLVKQFQQYINDRVITNSLVYTIDLEDGKPIVKLIDGDTGVCTKIIAKRIIVCTPQFINQRILSPSLQRQINYGAFSYAPWMTANLTLSSDLENKRGEALCWDNVIYGSSSLGYVHANHQTVSIGSNNKVITYYAPLVGNDLPAERQAAISRTYEQWYQLIIEDLKKPHPNIETGMKNLDVWIWGHGMIRPAPDFIFGTAQQAKASIENKIFFAHSDCSGISIFEEAFYSGTQAAKQVLS